jgi:magnesium transporter
MIVDCAVYQDGRRREGELALEDAYDAAGDPNAFVWIGLFEPTVEEFDAVRREFELHELAVEDAIEAHQRPKLEAYGDSFFVVLKTARWDVDQSEISFGEIFVFVGDEFLITVRHGETDLHEVRLWMEERPDLLRRGPGAALHAIVDRVVDDYEPVIQRLDAAIRDAEQQVFSPARTNQAGRIYGLKRQALALDGAIAPLVEPVAALASGRYEQVHEDLRTYFRDVYDHLARMAGHVESFRELLTNVLTANLTQVSIRQNEDVRKISAWAAIIAVPTLITGVYGMNFERMPELTWTIGYPGALVLMALVCVGLYTYFHKVGWL